MKKERFNQITGCLVAFAMIGTGIFTIKVMSTCPPGTPDIVFIIAYMFAALFIGSGAIILVAWALV